MSQTNDVLMSKGRISYRLDSVCEFINGGAWSDSEYVADGIHVVKVTNLSNGRIVRRDDNFLPISKYEEYKQHELRSWDIVVSTVGSHPTQPGSVVGRVALAYPEFAGSFLNQNAACIRVKKPNLVSQRYLFYLANTVLFKHHIESRARGSANQVRMAIGELKKFETNYPCLTEQKQIAAILSAYDDLIDNNQRRIALLEKVAEEIYREWFVRMRFPGHEKVTKIKGVPEGWQVKSLGQLALQIRDKYVAHSHQEWPLVDLEKMTPKSLAVLNFGHANELATSRTVFAQQDVLFSSIRPYLHKVNMAPFPGVTNTSVMVLRPRQPEYRSFLTIALFMESTIAWADQYATGTKMPVIAWNVFKNMEIFDPGVNLIAKFNEVTAPILDQINGLAIHIAKLSQVRDLVLPRLISGKLLVENLDIQYPPSMTEEANAAHA